MELQELKSILDSDEFHHATYRNVGTLWEGLWIYRKNENGFQGFEPAGNFSKSSADLDAAHDLCGMTGISFGARGEG
jgi:hypothetical protein